MINSRSRFVGGVSDALYQQHASIISVGCLVRSSMPNGASANSQSKVDIARLRGGSLSTRMQTFKFSMQNVEGLSETKEVELVVFMQSCGIGVLCVRETHKRESGVRKLPSDFLLILSSCDITGSSDAELGFVVAPHLRRSIITYCLHSDRTCMLELRTYKGKIAILSAYATAFV